MRKFLCKVFGHKWKYFFSLSNGIMEKTEIRVCSRCGAVQKWSRIPFIAGERTLWLAMIERTKKNAKQYWENIENKIEGNQNE